jgi:hypothetical protein
MAKPLLTRLWYRGMETMQRLRHGIVKRPEYLKPVDLFAGEVAQKIQWPNKRQAVLNLQFDDFCPKTSPGDLDYGGTPNAGVNKLFFDTLRKFPSVKATLFTIPAPRFREVGLYNDPHDEQRFSVANPTHKRWAAWIRAKKNIEIADHGLHHYQDDVRYAFPFAEFMFKDLRRATKALRAARELFAAAGMHVHGTRPPAYELGKNLAFVDAAKQAGFSYIAASTPIYGLNLFRKRVSNIYPHWFRGMLNIPGNLSIHQPLANIKDQIDKIVAMHGVITLRGHYVLGTEHMANGIDARTMQNMEDVIRYLVERYPNKIWFATAHEIAQWYTQTARKL